MIRTMISLDYTSVTGSCQTDKLINFMIMNNIVTTVINFMIMNKILTTVIVTVSDFIVAIVTMVLMI